MLNANFSNISAISWRQVLLVEEIEVHGKNHDLPQVTDNLYQILLFRVHLASEFELKTVVVMGTD